MLGKVIAFEGVDGCGKGTQVKLVNEKLTEMGFKTIVLDFPRYDTFFGKQIGKLLSGEDGYTINDIDVLSAALWFAVDRAQAFKDIDINDFDYVLMNRSTLSNVVYQTAKCDGALGVLKRGYVTEFIWKLERELDIPMPDMFIIYDIDKEALNTNMDNRDKKEYLEEDRDLNEKDTALLKRVQAFYRQIQGERNNVHIINASVEGKMLPENIITSITMTIITEKLYQY